MRIAATVIGVLAILLGGVWVLQGLNVLPGSFMTGDPKWAVIGVVAAAVGAVLVWWLNRTPKAG